MDYKDLRSIQETYNGMYSEEVVEEGLAGMVDKATKAGQAGLEKMGVKINRTPKPTARPSVRTQDTMRQNKTSMEEVDVFDIVKGHLIDEGATEEEALKAMLSLTEEEINAIVEAVGIVGPPKKAIDKVPGVRNFRIGLSNAVKRSDYGPNDDIKKVGKHVVPTPRLGGKFDRPGGTKYKDISGDK